MKYYFAVVVTISLLMSVEMFAGDNPRSVRAVQISTPLHIDGILNEEAWKLAEPATGFIQRDPEEGKPASERSEIRVLYDDEALYFGCIFFDSQPENIVARLTRRDDEIESDRASIRIDSYHDHQTGYEFTFNAAGVKVDILQYEDANKEDESWDPVWEVQTNITSQGWSAEVKIPFRILRYRSNSADSTDNVWGINFLRYISRKQESERWAFTPKSQSGFISRYGHLVGLRHLPEPRQIDALPFIIGKQNYQPVSNVLQKKREFFGNAGLDLKYGISSNFTIDATVNPDFGQVEADLAVLNLSTFETFYPEKRPFFIEGTQIIRFTTFGGEFGPGMFYSRRIGRALSPDEVSVPAGGRIEDMPQTTTILGAAKFTGKTSGGFSIGVLQAVTQEEQAVVVDSSGIKSEQVLEPLAHYTIVRLKHDVLDNSSVGMILTSVEKRSLYPAFTNGYDWNLKFAKNTYQLDGFLAFSRTTNLDNERITGSAGKVEYSKIAGEHWLWTVSGDFTSKRYNINDVGFFFRPNDFGGSVIINYKEDTPAEVVRNYIVGLSLFERRNFDGAKLTFIGAVPVRGARLNTSILFTNYWRVNASMGYDIGGFDDRETRGNGLYEKPKSGATAVYVFTDNRQDVVAKAGVRYGWDTKTFRQAALELGVDLKPLSWMEYVIETEYVQLRNLEAWADNVSIGGTTESIFGDRSTDQYNLTLRSTITFTRDLTLQVYGQVFLAKRHYENFRRLVGTSDFMRFTYTGNPDFNRQSLNTNIVLRWEYLPGSTMFLVWSQARRGNSGDYFTSFGRDFSDTFQVSPFNVILLKLTYFWSL